MFTCRPDFQSAVDGQIADVTTSTSTRLTADEAAELIHRVAGDKTLPDEIVADVVAKTDGVPLFIEELTKTLLESGLLEEQLEPVTSSPGRYRRWPFPTRFTTR